MNSNKIISEESKVLTLDTDEMQEFYEYYTSFYQDVEGSHPFKFPTFEEFKAVVKEVEAMDLDTFIDSFSREFVKWMWLAKLNNKSLTLPELMDLFWGRENPSLDWVEKALEQNKDKNLSKDI